MMGAVTVGRTLWLTDINPVFPKFPGHKET